MVELAIRSTPTRRIKLSRRRMMQLAAALSVTSGCLPGADVEGGGDGIAKWPHDIAVPKVDHPGYGTYPNYDEIGETRDLGRNFCQTHRRSNSKNLPI